MSHLLFLPLLLYIDFGGHQSYSLKTENCYASKTNSSLVRFNRAYHQNEFGDDEVEMIKNHFDTTPFAWFVEEHDYHAGDILNQHGFFKYPDPFCGMIADIENFSDAHYASHITVKEINEKEDIQTLIDIISRSNTYPVYEKCEWERSIYALLKKGSPSIKLYLGFYADEPCAASIIIYHQNAVTLHLISTLPEHRCKGLGYAVTHKALFDAACKGKTQAVLTATLMGQSLYKKMGFKEYAQYYIYLHLPAA